MRTTLNIDDDVLSAVRERARYERRSAGEVLSDLARQGLTAGRPDDDLPDRGADDTRYSIRNGFRVLRSRGGIVTNDLIDRIRDEEGI